jgi:hypothetical protein
MTVKNKAARKAGRATASRPSGHVQARARRVKVGQKMAGSRAVSRNMCH